MRKYGISLGQNSLPGSPIGLHCMTLPDSVSKHQSSHLVPPSLGCFFVVRYGIDQMIFLPEIQHPKTITNNLFEAEKGLQSRDTLL